MLGDGGGECSIGRKAEGWGQRRAVAAIPTAAGTPHRLRLRADALVSPTPPQGGSDRKAVLRTADCALSRSHQHFDRLSLRSLPLDPELVEG